MPELPEVEALARFLGEHLVGREVARVELGTVSALKTVVPPLDSLVGRLIGLVERRGKMLAVRAQGDEPLWMVLHLARGGWVRWQDEMAAKPVRPGKGPLALRIRLSGGGGIDVTEAGTEKRLAVWMVSSPDAVDQVARLGPDPLAEDFDRAALARAMSGPGTDLKHALSDQSRVAGIGNAYSDEILHAARMSPFKPASKLSEEELERLHSALVRVLSDAVERSAGLPASGLKADKRSAMRVHGRAGEACPVCGDLVREVAFASRSLQYCANCQTGGKPLADRRLSRLLK